jgi:carbonic anhydrase/acetyltransferase-like protein (isoleucine patch superfamily)
MRTDGPFALRYGGFSPEIASDAFIAPSAQLIGNVRIGSQSSIWYGCILRGDVNHIYVGNRSNLQDGTIVHVTPDTAPVRIGSDVLVGHAALIHGCELQDGSFVGMRATVLNNAVVESGALIAAGALVTEGTLVKSNEMWAGVPARKLGLVPPALADIMRAAVRQYVQLAKNHAAAIEAQSNGATDISDSRGGESP